MADLTIAYPSTDVREKILQNRSASPSSSPSPPAVRFDDAATETTCEKKSPQQPKKLKKKWSGDRSSLNSRYKKPKVGTRKYQRWLNEAYLNHDWTALAEGMDHHKEDQIDLFELNEECLSRPNFSFFPEEIAEERAEEMFDFWYGGSSLTDDLSREGEVEELKEKEKEEKKGEKEREVDEDLARFWKIPRLARRTVARCCHSLFLQELEEDLTSYLLWLGRIEGEGEGEGEDEGFAAVGPEGEGEEFLCNSLTYECTLKCGRRRESEGEEEDEDEGWGELEFLFPDSLTRFLAHSVCRYYGLSSRSWGKEGNRKTAVYLSTGMGGGVVPAPPSVSLRNFILCSYLSS